MHSQKGYSLVEVGVGIVILTIFLTASITVFNGAYSNYRIVQQRNIALSYATDRIEDALVAELGNIDANIQTVTPTPEELQSGNYCVPVDTVEQPSDTTNNMRITTQYRRIPTKIGSTDKYDSKILRVIVTVEYKIKSTDTEYKQFQLETIKVN